MAKRTAKIEQERQQGRVQTGEVDIAKLLEWAFTKSEAANEKRFATLYRYLLGIGASIVVIMITLFLVN